MATGIHLEYGSAAIVTISASALFGHAIDVKIGRLN
jgi:hypothetical protein